MYAEGLRFVGTEVAEGTVAQTIEEWIDRVLLGSACNQWGWTGDWWSFGELVIVTKTRTWSTSRPQVSLPGDLLLLGCSGLSSKGHWNWVGWDLDVGHGTKSYGTTAAAVADARRVRDWYHGNAEIRLSKSGHGVHVRHPLSVKHPPGHPKEESRRIAEMFTLKADPTSLSRQVHFLWSRDVPSKQSFMEVESCF